MIEREMKFLVDEAEFQRLLAQVRQAYPDIEPQEIDQTNHYFDTPDLRLYQRQITLRVREKRGVFVLEKKENLAFDGAVRTARESKYPVDALPERIHATAVGLDGDDTFTLLGHLRTQRTRFALPDGTNIDFDVSDYCGVRDFEVEVEEGEGMPEDLLCYLPTAAAKNIGKLARFVKKFLQMA
jgi:uncharacterized protein YjbK